MERSGEAKLRPAWWEGASCRDAGKYAWGRRAGGCKGPEQKGGWPTWGPESRLVWPELSNGGRWEVRSGQAWPDHEQLFYSECQHPYFQVMLTCSHWDKWTFSPWQIIWVETRNATSNAERGGGFYDFSRFQPSPCFSKKGESLPIHRAPDRE